MKPWRVVGLVILNCSRMDGREQDSRANDRESFPGFALALDRPRPGRPRYDRGRRSE